MRPRRMNPRRHFHHQSQRGQREKDPNKGNLCPLDPRLELGLTQDNRKAFGHKRWHGRGHGKRVQLYGIDLTRLKSLLFGMAFGMEFEISMLSFSSRVL